MLPYIKLFGHYLPMYGLLISFGTVLGVGTACLRAKMYNILKEDALYAAFYGLIGVFVGAKLLYIATVFGSIINNFDYMVKNPQTFIDLLRGGFVFYGGLIGAFMGLYRYSRKFNIVTIDLFDLLISSVPLILAFGRLGCYFAGCCYGKEVMPPLGVRFDLSSVAPHGIYLLPVQLYESVFNFALFILFVSLFRKRHKKGLVTGLYLTLYSVQRFVIEFFRGDEERGFVFLNISTSQFIGIFIFLAGGLFVFCPNLFDKKQSGG